MKKLKSTFVAIIIGASAMAQAGMLRGGVSGGGGGMTNPNPPTVQDVVDVIENDAGQILLGWLNFQKHKLSIDLQTDEDEKEEVKKTALYKMFFAEKSIFSEVKKLKVEIEKTKPCYDLFGEEKDGSIHSKTPGHICISAYNIAKKASKYIYKQEVAGLILHEVTHLVGFEAEEIPVKVQSLMVEDLMEYKWSDLLLDKKELFGERWGLFRYVNSLLRTLKSNEESYTSSEFDNFDGVLRDVFHVGRGKHRKISYIDEDTRHAIFAEELRMNVIDRMYNKWKDPKTPTHVKADIEIDRAKVFKGAREISMDDYILRYLVDGDVERYERERESDVYKTITLERPDDFETVSSNLNRTSKLLEVLKGKMMKFGMFKFEVLK